jgi:hypothetical protein
MACHREQQLYAVKGLGMACSFCRDDYRVVVAVETR